METKIKSDINFMSFRIDDMIIITLQANEHGWFEGYRARDSTRCLGVSHIDFIKPLY